MVDDFVPAAGDLVWLAFSPQAGREQAGRRPAIVISPRAYNAAVGLMLACPITSKVKGYPFEVAVPKDAGISGVVLSDHLRSLDWRSRNADLISTGNDSLLSSVREKLLTLIVSD